MEDLKEEKKVVKKKDKVVLQTKVIIRKLPTSMTEEYFLELFEPLPKNDFFRFVPGDRTLAPNNFARAYINFLNPDEILSFRDKYDGIPIERNGHSSICVVEYAPYQRIGRRLRRKEDQKSDTILQDPDYAKFLESMDQAEEKECLDVEQYLEELEARELNNEVVETPLTKYIKQRREEKKRMREERRKLELERRRKRDEEKRERKKKEAEKKKKLEAAKAKKTEATSRNDYDGKKTLAETRPSTATSKNDDGCGDDGKVKILQKEQKESSGSGTTRFQPKSFQERPKETIRSKTFVRDSSRDWKSESTDAKSYGKNDESESRYKSNKEFKRQTRGGYYRGSSTRTERRGANNSSSTSSSGQGGQNSETSQQKNPPQKYSEQRSSRGLGSRKNFGGEW